MSGLRRGIVAVAVGALVGAGVGGAISGSAVHGPATGSRRHLPVRPAAPHPPSCAVATGVCGMACAIEVRSTLAPPALDAAGFAARSAALTAPAAVRCHSDPAARGVHLPAAGG